MSLFTVVQRLLDKAGTSFIEPRREDGHGSSAVTPTFVDTGLTTQTDALTNAELRAAPVVVSTGLTQPTTPADTQPVSGTVGADAVRRPTLTRTFVASTAGTVIALTPTSGKKLRVSWYSLQAGPDNSATVTAAIRFGVAGADVHTIDLSKYGQMFAHSFGGAEDYVEGAVDQPLYLYTSADQRTILNLDYKEV